VAAAHKIIRQHIPTLTRDRAMADDIHAMAELVFEETIIKAAKQSLESSIRMQEAG
jgi:histidine ammonia-lyase